MQAACVVPISRHRSVFTAVRLVWRKWLAFAAAGGPRVI